MPTPKSWYDQAGRFREFTDPERTDRVDDMTPFQAIGYALMETEHQPGFVQRAPYFLRALAKAGYRVTKR